MIKNYTDASLQAGDEIDFVEKYWTNKWQTVGINSDAYFQHAYEELQKQEELKITENYLLPLPKGAKILDGGCGLGLWTLYFSSKGYETHGLDISKSSVEILNKRFPQNHFSVGDIRKTNFSNAFFDAYFSWGTFEHFENGLGPCFEEAQRLLKPSATLLISVPFANTRHAKSLRKLTSKPPQLAQRFYQWRLSEQELQVEFERHGFEFLAYYYTSKMNGIERYLHHEWNVDSQKLLGKIIKRVLYYLLPASYISHMIIGVGRKRT